MDLINHLIDSYNIPLLSAFLIGLLAAISPCALATNIAAIAYISKDITQPKRNLLSSLFYTLGRGITYTLLAILIYFGFSTFQISRLFHGWGDLVLGPILILMGLLVLDVIHLNFNTGKFNLNQLQEKLAQKGHWGALLLGMLFALAFCPQSGVLFFGVLIPLVLSSSYALFLPLVFAFSTGLPVIVFAIIIAVSLKKVGETFKLVQKFEKIVRYVMAGFFIATGIYFCRFLVEFFLRM